MPAKRSGAAFERLLSRAFIMHEVATPNVIPIDRPQPNTGSVVSGVSEARSELPDAKVAQHACDSPSSLGDKVTLPPDDHHSGCTVLPVRSSHAPDEVHSPAHTTDDVVSVGTGPEYDRPFSTRLDSFPDCHAHDIRLCEVSPGLEVARRSLPYSTCQRQYVCSITQIFLQPSATVLPCDSSRSRGI